MNLVSVLQAHQTDLSRLLPLVLGAAEQRSRLEPHLWPLHADAAARICSSLEREFQYPETFAWFMAERAGEVVGCVKSGRYPAPPVYAELLAGLTGDELYASDSGVFSLLLDASEHFQREGGVAVINAACPASDTGKLQFLQARGYQSLTLWMTCAVNESVEPSGHVRPAIEADIPALVRLNANAQEEKWRANPRFWTPHADAQARFSGWMGHCLTLADRDLLVSDKNGVVNGFVIVQPTNSPPAHDSGRVTTLDDLAADDWDTFRELLEAAHAAAARRGYLTLQAICPANWPERVQALQEAGFHAANLWLMKDEPLAGIGSLTVC